jgi:hypothetical protein
VHVRGFAIGGALARADAAQPLGTRAPALLVQRAAIPDVLGQLGRRGVRTRTALTKLARIVIS